MPVNELQIRIAGPADLDGDVLLGDLRSLCQNLAFCLQRSEEIVSGHARIRHRIVGLSSGSATIALSPLRSENGHVSSGGVYDFFVETVESLQAGKSVDTRLTTEDLKAYRNLAKLVARGEGSVQIRDTLLTWQYLATIDKIIGASIPSEGTVTGRLERLNLHNKSEFAVYAPIGGFSALCTFPESMLDEVKAAIKRTVTVSGKLFFKPDTPFPEKVQVREIELHSPDDELPTLASLRGLMKGGTSGLSTVRFLRTIRDD